MQRTGFNRWSELKPGGEFAQYAIHSGLLTSLLASPGQVWDLDRHLLGGVNPSLKGRPFPGTQEGPRGTRPRPPQARPLRPARSLSAVGRRDLSIKTRRKKHNEETVQTVFRSVA